MIDMFGWMISVQMFFNIMVSFSFFIGIILMVSPEAFEVLNKALQREYGIKIRIIPAIEDTSVDVIDRVIIRNRTIVGIIISVVSFGLLLLYH